LLFGPSHRGLENSGSLPEIIGVPDPLDPTDAFLSAFTGMWMRTFAFFGVTAGAALCGANIHEAPNLVANFGTNGLNAVWDFFRSIHPGLALMWMLMMVHSLFIWWTLPFALLYIWLLAKLWRDAELFDVLFVLALVHPVHVFIYGQCTQPLTGLPLAGGVALLVVFEVVMAALILWWRRVSQNAPDLPPDENAEPEL